MKYIFALAILAFAVCQAPLALADRFGVGDENFEIEFVPIGNPGNPPDTTGAPNPAGQVNYPYRIAKYEIAEGMFDIAADLGGFDDISHSHFGADRPVQEISWYDATKFVNWLNTSKGFAPAYKYNIFGEFQLWSPGDAGYDPHNRFRNRLARYVLPSVDEWYKAAYYDPQLGIYYDYPTGSDNVPDGIDFPGDSDFDAVFQDGLNNSLSNIATDVGLPSPFGTFGQGGNAWELMETEYDLVNDSVAGDRIARGGFFYLPSFGLRSSTWDPIPPDINANVNGIRVVSVPEPTTAFLGVLLSAGKVASERRKYRRRVRPFPI
jgi:formylglycine-generating enzyme required for sulfatase activity